MAFCTNCGTQGADSIKFCTSCGTSMVSDSTIPPVQAVQQPIAQPVQPTPQAVTQPTVTPAHTLVVTYKEEPISTRGYVGIILLMLLPVLNLLLLIIWACGGCSKINKRNLSRAILIWMLIGTVLSGLIFLAGGLLFSEQINALKELGTSIIN